MTLVPIVQRFDSDKAKDILLASDVVFISGGDVDLGMKYLRKRDLIPSLKELYERWKTFLWNFRRSHNALPQLDALARSE